jgi:glycine/D-amino acid oxidase-like deaminating enzyme
VLRAEKLDAKTLIHNFGHGGAGMSLSWGTASMATDLALPHQDRRAAVLGSGVVGLTSARELQRHGFEVTIYAATVPPDTTSNMSLAAFTPTSGLYQQANRTAEWDAQFRHAVRIAYRRLQLLAGPKYGISWITHYQLMDTEPGSGGGGGQQAPGFTRLMPDDINYGDPVVLQPGEHNFPTKLAEEAPDLRIEPSIYLDALMNDFLLWGGKVVIRKFDTPADIAALGENVIVNCTGLGSKAIFNDPELVPLKGQLTVLIPQSEITYATGGPQTPGAGFVHMMPRNDGIVLGGTSLRDDWSLDVNEEQRKRIVDTHVQLFNGMRSIRT